MEDNATQELQEVNTALANIELPKNISYSVALRALRRMVGPHGRIWRRTGNVIEVGTQVGPTAYVLGAGVDYGSALKMAAMTVAQAFHDVNQEKLKNGSGETVSQGAQADASGDSRDDVHQASPEAPAADGEAAETGS